MRWQAWPHSGLLATSQPCTYTRPNVATSSRPRPLVLKSLQRREPSRSCTVVPGSASQSGRASSSRHRRLPRQTAGAAGLGPDGGLLSCAWPQGTRMPAASTSSTYSCCCRATTGNQAKIGDLTTTGRAESSCRSKHVGSFPALRPHQKQKKGLRCTCRSVACWHGPPCRSDPPGDRSRSSAVPSIGVSSASPVCCPHPATFPPYARRRHDL
mmetsp:Transcript_24566/g.41910  ORF Transcript_24566/g.41910 Transcript_24566/m.41910 type:complete len:212 (+) Transcript_24566:219-854(+)